MGSISNKFLKWHVAAHGAAAKVTWHVCFPPGRRAKRAAYTGTHNNKKSAHSLAPSAPPSVCELSARSTSVIKDKIEESDQELVFYCQFNTWSFTLACSLALFLSLQDLSHLLTTYFIAPLFLWLQLFIPGKYIARDKSFLHTPRAHFFARA